MVATGQEIVREKKILQGQGKVREFHFESGKIYIFGKKSGKSDILRVLIYLLPSQWCFCMVHFKEMTHVGLVGYCFI